MNLHKSNKGAFIHEKETISFLSDIMPELINADLRIMNLESPLAPAEIGSPIRKAGPNLTGRPKNIGFLKAAGCDLALMANKHAMDFGVDYMHYTESLLSENNIAHIAIFMNITTVFFDIFTDQAVLTFFLKSAVGFLASSKLRVGRLIENTALTSAFSQSCAFPFHMSEAHRWHIASSDWGRVSQSKSK